MSNEPSYLVADIGGTNARFAIARGSVSRGFDLDQVRRLKNEDFEHLRDAAMAYLESCEGDRPGRACFAVASPIRAGRVQLTNATWSFRPDELGGELDKVRSDANRLSENARRIEAYTAEGCATLIAS